MWIISVLKENKMAVREIAELIKTLSAEKGVAVEAVIKELQASLVTFDSLEFTVRTQNVLAANVIDSVDELCSYSEKELKALPLVSKKMVLEVKSVLESRGLTLKAGSEEDVEMHQALNRMKGGLK